MLDPNLRKKERGEGGRREGGREGGRKGGREGKKEPESSHKMIMAP